MRYLLDTNIVIAAIKKQPAVLTKMADIQTSNLILSPIVLGELELGVLKSKWQKANAERLLIIKKRLPLIPLNAETSYHYGKLRAQLELQGTPIGANDYWIAAHTISLHAVLVTGNIREFARVENLQIENWLEL
ncbi:twitching motility protein PilT [Achromatium sp. WMS3]|nr:twitching motility protein PilT [Achromatium sp. WMS3]